MATQEPTRESLLSSAARLPEHVVYRTFVKETVILNLKTARYHGLNPTAGRMLEVLERSPTVGDAATKLAGEYERPVDDVGRDLYDFCVQLLDRGLIELRSVETS
jgi:hypothetical protein